jgi:hypothetical protein
MAGLAPVVAIYVSNPHNRIFSYHGLCHGAVAYQVANNVIPPSHPYLGGYPMRYHWGYHFLAGTLTRLFEITPFHAFAVINTISLLVALILVFRIARRLLADETAGLFATFVALFAVTGISIRMLEEHVSDPFAFLYFLDHRGVPVFEKFTNVNGVPVGVASFALFLYALIRICETRPRFWSGLALFVSLAVCGFVYPPMLLGFVATAGAAWVTTTWLRRDLSLRRHAVRLAAIAGSCAVGLLVVWPYLSEVAAGYARSVTFLGFGRFRANLLNLVVVVLPVAVVVFLMRRQLMARCSKVALAVTSAACGANGLLYLCIHQPERNEYKYLILSMISCGIPGGIALFLAKRRLKRVGIVGVVVLLMMNPAYEIAKKSESPSDDEVRYVESGRDLQFRSRKLDELYEWIRRSTPHNSVFIDTTNMIPVVGQRALYVSLYPTLSCGIVAYKMFRVTNGDVIEKRREVAEALVAGEKLPAREERRLAALGRPLYLVDRTGRLESRLDRETWKVVFRSTAKPYVVFQHLR